MQEFFDMVIGFLTKLGTVLVDRRALITAAIYGVLGLLGLFGLTSDTIEQLRNLIDSGYGGLIDLNAAVLLLATIAAQFVALIAPLLGLLASWAKREPSGLNGFKPTRK